MATIIRCDNCKKLSDESGSEYIGKEWAVKKYKDLYMNIICNKDYCGACVKKLIGELAITRPDKDGY